MKESAIKPRRKAPTGAKKLLKLIGHVLDDGKAEDIVTIDLADKTSIADFMIVATGGSQRQLGALSDKVVEAVKDFGLSPVPTEGRELGDWVLIDAGDVIVHLFRPETRTHYNLEKMWGADFAETERAAV